jgi:peptidase E
MSGRILAIGGGDGFDGVFLALAAKPHPRVCYLPTASADDAESIVRFYERFTRRPCEPYHVEVFGMPEKPAERVAAADVVIVAGGNTANMLALWRLHGIDRALQEAWAAGAVLGGWSAGANCWFESCVTDSFGPQLDPLNDGLAFLQGSFCPHYDGEELRRPVYMRLVDDGSLAAGIACDDGAAALYEGTSLTEIVATRPGARGYRVTPGGEEPLEARLV